MKVRVVVVVVPVYGAGGVGGALASPFGDNQLRNINYLFIVLEKHRES